MLDKTKLQEKLIELGANPFLKGFEYTVEALRVIDIEQGNRVKLMDIYEEVAKETGSTRYGVERSIRHFFVHFRKDPEGAKMIREKGTNGETLFLLYYKLLQKGESGCNTES